MKKRLTKDEIGKIKQLRSRGYSLPEISRELSIAKTTVFVYLKDVEILPEFKAQWLGKRGGSKKRQLAKEAQALKYVKEQIKNVSYKEKLLFISALYWAEGSKKDCGLSNTDPNLIKVYINGLREVFKIEDDRFRISIRIYEDLNKDKCLNFWSNVVNIPKEKFVNVNVLKGKKFGKLKYGMCRIRVSKGGDILKRLIAVNKVISELT